MQTQEVVIKPNLRVVLKADAQKLDEVVVTAMGISREKKALGYAVQDVKSDALTRAANTDLAGALQGKVSGIDITPSSGMPGASSKITIRGSRSFTGDNTPLYVIDGMPIASTADVSTSLTDGSKVPPEPCAYSCCSSGRVEILSKERLVLKVIVGFPLSAPLPLLVVITITPLEALIPYKAEAACPFNILILSISLGSMSTARLA